MPEPILDSATSVAPTSGVSAPLEPAGPQYMYGTEDNVPEWLKGKTKEEVATLAGQMYQSVVQGTSGPVAPPVAAAPAAPAAPIAPVAPVVPTGDEWLTDGAAAADVHFTTRAQEFQDTHIAPQFAAIFESNAQTARALSRQEFSGEFSKWGPEIDLQMQAIPLNQRTTYMYSQAVGLVRGKHASEINQDALKGAVDAELERRAAAGDLRSGAAAGGSLLAPDGLDFDSPDVLQEYKRFKEIPEADLIKFLGMAYPNLPLHEARAMYMKKLIKKDVITAGAS